MVNGEIEYYSRGKPEETTIITDTLRWSTMQRLGGIDGNPVLRRNEERALYAYTELYERWATGDERKYAWALRDEMLIKY